MDVDQDTFEALVSDALDQIPEELGHFMENVAVFVEDWPTPEQLGGRRGTLLGLYQGVSLTRRSSLNYGGAMPDRITVFRGRSAASLGTKPTWSTSSPGRSSMRWRITSASPTPGCTNWGGVDGRRARPNLKPDP